ncbi:DUF3299 domain-containing protein [Cocleimonas sp. KMM 6892]|uniref:DUF3299 domain-containing protein n=1 Tax=unclassified Cocleimonas TaxID=2639732 RepID=UPI002DB7618D|nr:MULTISPECIES: DUF3299 domain-containing protein [unclassified Cocleimonas]MEB8433535.1 DUF3299 domain-containing protein [Cocleimonas sp. KMM 6892]MEC4716346.1 DUF3299 domain-containing protein [Cocleimonas sp. KMM 6895]MEC4745761.1 DUF3299 domain-containing protein [Cocleimonas sp. KMM 6896]
MFKNNQLSSILAVSFLTLLLSACGEETADSASKDTEQQTTSAESKVDTAKTAKAEAKTNDTATVKEEETVVPLVADTTPETTDKSDTEDTANAKQQDSNAVETISWDKLIPESYDPSVIIDKYSEELESLTDDDPKAMELYGKIQAELDNAPVNMSLDGKTIKMPGFIAPLENNNGIISEFLLVPYFGACIHVPAPPVNQTVMIKAKDGEGIKSEESSLPIWITGQLKAVEERTSIGAAGYRIENAQIEPYTEE